MTTRPIGTVYFDKSTRGLLGKHRLKNRWRADIQINGTRYRQYVKSEEDGRKFCLRMYEQLKGEVEKKEVAKSVSKKMDKNSSSIILNKEQLSNRLEIVRQKEVQSLILFYKAWRINYYNKKI